MSNSTERIRQQTELENAFDDLVTLIDPLSWSNAFVFFFGTLYFGTPWWKALIISFIVLVVTRFHYGRRLLVKGSILLMIATLAVWSEALPDMSWLLEAAKNCSFVKTGAQP